MAFSIGYKIEFLNRFSAVGVKLDKAFNAIGRNARKASNKIRGFNNNLDKSERKAKKATMTFESLRNGLLGIAAAGFAIALPIRQAVAFESAMSDVRKVVDFDTPKQFKEFGKDILNLSKIIPLTAVELSDIAAAGGQFGLKAQQLPGFIKEVSKASVAWDISTQDAGQSMAKLANVLNEPIGKISETSDAINHLSNNMAHNAAQLLEVTLRGGSAGKMFGLTTQQIAAMGSSLLAMGIRQERAGTTMDIMMRKFTEIAREDRFFKRDYMKSPQDAITKYLEKIAAIEDPLKRAAFITDKFGDEGARGIKKLVGSMDKYKLALDLVSKSTNFLGSVQKEYNIRSKTTGNKLKILKNNATALSVTFGTALLPIVNLLATALIAIIKPIQWLFTEVPSLAIAITVLAGAFLVAKTASLLFAGAAAVAGGIALAPWLAFAAAITAIGWAFKQTSEAIKTFKGFKFKMIGGLFENQDKALAKIQDEANAKFGSPEMQAKVKSILGVENKLTSEKTSQNLAEQKVKASVAGNITVSAAKGTQVDSAEMSNAGFMRDIGFNLPFAGAGA